LACADLRFSGSEYRIELAVDGIDQQRPESFGREQGENEQANERDGGGP
jgi:hypothetical protein